MSSLSPSTFSAASAPEAFMMSMKPGCRGDPRMNRAVTAKLENPHISLYDALDIGGFTYPRNVDAATMDNDHVTLGQRKNQLNRRLRMARKTGGNKSKGESDSSSTASPNKPSVRGTSPLVIANSYMRQRRSKTAVKPATKRAAPAKTVQPPAKKQCLNKVAQSTSSTPSATVQLPKGLEISLNNALTQTMTVTREYGSVSPVSDDVSPLPNFPASNLPTLATSTAPKDDAWWPTANSFLDLPNKEANVNQHLNLVVADFNAGCVEQSQTMAMSLQTNGNKRTVSTSSFVSASTAGSQQQQQQYQQRESALGGQLAQNLRQQLQCQVPEQEKEELGLQIFRSGLQDLYQKSMMAAGFAPRDAGESSQTFHRFAFQAWKNECERLQVLLGDHVVEQEQTGQQALV